MRNFIAVNIVVMNEHSGNVAGIVSGNFTIIAKGNSMKEHEYENYMKRLNREYSDYKIYAAQNISYILDNPGELLDMRYAYEYLSSKDIPHNELEYVMKARNPIHVTVKHKMSLTPTEHSMGCVSLAINDIWEKKALDHGEIELYDDRIPICFHRKMSNLDEILSLPRNRKDDVFQIEKIIELTERQFKYFGSHLLSDDALFIQRNKDLMWYENNCAHCLLVTTPERNTGILVNAEGYNYARYSAYVSDCKKLDLHNIPIEKYEDIQRSGRKHSRFHER